MKKYDPLEAPEREAWLDLDEGERIELVEAHHLEVGPTLPNLRMHAVVHVIVENRIAEGDPHTRNALARLVDEGLDRHDALHAIGSVLVERLQMLLDGSGAQQASAEQAICEELDHLTVERWHAAFEEG